VTNADEQEPKEDVMSKQGIFVVAVVLVLVTFCPPLMNFSETHFFKSASAVQQTPPLRFASPVGGETWPIHTAQSIRWSMKDVPEDARLSVELVGESMTREISTDDGIAEDTLIEDGNLIVVNRVRPSRYPATLKRMSILFRRGPSPQPDPTSRRVTLLVFADPTGSGPPGNPNILYQQQETITSTGTALSFNVPDIVLREGDFYVGYQAPDPANGVGFALDLNGQPRQSAFVSRNRGMTFQPLQVTSPAGVMINPNVLIRATVEEPGTPPVPLSENVPIPVNAGSFCWRVTGPTNMRARLRIFSPDHPTVNAMSEPFTISAPLQSITVTAPAANDTWPVGQNRIITWTSQDVAGLVNIVLSRDDGQTFPEMICAGCENNGIRQWRVTGNQPAVARIKVSSFFDPHLCGFSHRFFIGALGQSYFDGSDESESFAASGQDPTQSSCPCVPPRAPAAEPLNGLRVDVPNLGEVWRVGDTRRIYWSSNGVTGNVRIEFSTDAGATFQAIPGLENTANDGAAEWTMIPATARSSTCLIRVSTLDGMTSATSNGVFVIDFPGRPTITLLVPNGGEEYVATNKYRIRWRNNGNVGGLVKFELSFDGGRTFMPVPMQDRVTNNTEREWTVPTPPATTTRARLRILAQDDRFIADVTNCDFTIRR
jgi:hypothetical protein